jgi:Mn-dependent DtxR family transcriptional regulator
MTETKNAPAPAKTDNRAPLHRCLEALIEGPLDLPTLAQRLGVTEPEANAMVGRLATAALTERLSGGQWRLTSEGLKHTIAAASAIPAK